MARGFPVSSLSPSEFPHLQLDRVPPRPRDLFEIPGTSRLPFGVEPPTPAGLPARFVSVTDPPRRARVRSWLALSVACWTLLGHGETQWVDPRFATPATTVTTYWDALGRDDIRTVAECFVDPDAVVPKVGSVWFLPRTRRIDVRALRYGSSDTGDLVVTYEVRFVPMGANEEQRFVIGSELVRVRGEWRIQGWADDPSWPDFRAVTPPIDI